MSEQEKNNAKATVYIFALLQMCTEMSSNLVLERKRSLQIKRNYTRMKNHINQLVNIGREYKSRAVTPDAPRILALSKTVDNQVKSIKNLQSQIEKIRARSKKNIAEHEELISKAATIISTIEPIDDEIQRWLTQARALSEGNRRHDAEVTP